VLAELGEIEGDDEPPPAVPPAWLEKRILGEATVEGRFVDVGDTGSLATLRMKTWQPMRREKKSCRTGFANATSGAASRARLFASRPMARSRRLPVNLSAAAILNPKSPRSRTGDASISARKARGSATAA
jgi:hypothetical protein